MLKTVVVVLILLGFAWGYHPTRVRMMRAIEPVVEALGPAGDLVVIPIQRYNAKTEVNFLVDQIQMHRTEGREVPDSRTFQAWLGKRVSTKNQGRDPWNHPYFLLSIAGRITVGSVGEDGERGTADDITQTLYPGN